MSVVPAVSMEKCLSDQLYWLPSHPLNKQQGHVYPYPDIYMKQNMHPSQATILQAHGGCLIMERDV